MMNLSEHHVPGSKDTYYIPDFVTADEEAYLLRKVRPQAVFLCPTFTNPSSDPRNTSAEMEATFESEVRSFTDIVDHFFSS